MHAGMCGGCRWWLVMSNGGPNTAAAAARGKRFSYDAPLSPLLNTAVYTRFHVRVKSVVHAHRDRVVQAIKVC